VPLGFLSMMLYLSLSLREAGKKLCRGRASQRATDLATFGSEGVAFLSWSWRLLVCMFDSVQLTFMPRASRGRRSFPFANL